VNKFEQVVNSQGQLSLLFSEELDEISSFITRKA